MVNPCKNKLLALHLQSISFGEERIATLAQLVEQRIRNAQVEGSNPLSGSKKIRRKDFRLVFFAISCCQWALTTASRTLTADRDSHPALK